MCFCCCFRKGLVSPFLFLHPRVETTFVSSSLVYVLCSTPFLSLSQDLCVPSFLPLLDSVLFHFSNVPEPECL